MLSKSTLIVLLLVPFVALAERRNQEYRIHITKEFKLSGDSKVAVINKYGKIVVNIWNRQECKADIEIVGFGKSDEQARKVAEMVEINASGDNNISFETRYNPSGRRGLDSKEYVNVNYTIYVPRTLKAMALQNNFGDVLARELPFSTDVAVNYGFFDIGEAGKSLRITMNYTDKARINKANDLNITANYSSLRCEDVNTLRVTSNNSKCTIGNADDIKLISSYDDYKVSNVKDIEFTSSYSDLKTDVLKSTGTFALTYSNLLVRRLSDDFRLIDIRTSYTDVKIGIADKTPYRIAARLSYGDLNTRNKAFKNISSIKKGNNLSFSAMTTNATDAAGLIKIAGSYSDVKLGGEF